MLTHLSHKMMKRIRKAVYCVTIVYFVVQTFSYRNRQGEMSALSFHKEKAHSNEKYRYRQTLIKDYCDAQHDDKDLMEVNDERYQLARFQENESLPIWFDYKHHLLWCVIPKSGSSSWTQHFAK